MRIVADASLVAKWVLPDRGREEPALDSAVEILRGVQAGELDVVQPPHWLAEVAAVVARLAPDAAAGILDLLDAMELRVVGEIDLYRRAASLAAALDHHVFDTLYHAVALAHQATLITADERYWRKARELGSVTRLADWWMPE